ncbi:bHLH family transcription factor [Xylariales sp. AK1849]|nr:bHLH family transcription factor [Xylariales sp. AK1849]
MMASYGFNQFGGGHNSGSGSIDPNDLAMAGAHGSSYSNNNFNSGSNGYSSGSALFGDEELLDTLNSPTGQDHSGLPGQDFGGMNGGVNMGFSHDVYPAQMNGYSNTPDGDPIQSPFVHSFGGQPQFQHMQRPSFGTSLQSPISYAGSPHATNEADGDFLNTKARTRLTQAQAQAMQRKTSNTRSPMTPGTAAAMASFPVGSHESPGFGAQPIRTPSAHHDKSPSGQWMATPQSMSSVPGSGLSSPMQNGYSHPHMAGIMQNNGTSLPARMGGPTTTVRTQEDKRKKRRESHNAVERRRRDNINERIQDLSKLVPLHRLEDEKIKKLLQSGTPLSPSLTGISQPGQATSGLAGPGAKRATGAGNITTGLPIEEKDKGPNKGDILNGAVSWTRDLMWMLHLKLQQHEEMINYIADLGGHVPFELTDEEKRMQTELMETITKNGPHSFNYSRGAGSGLRVPHHTDFKGDSLNGSSINDSISVSPDDNGSGDLDADLGSTDQFWHDPDDVKEEDEYAMDLGI